MSGAGYSEFPKCFELNTKVNCEKVRTDAIKPRSLINIICATILAVAVVISITVIATVILIVRKRQIVEQERTREEQERNDQYGTYYQGVQYNTANDANPRYNEDGGNDDAVVTDENIYYQLAASTTDHNPRHNQNGGNNDATSPNGNIYFQL